MNSQFSASSFSRILDIQFHEREGSLARSPATALRAKNLIHFDTQICSDVIEEYLSRPSPLVLQLGVAGGEP